MITDPCKLFPTRRMAMNAGKLAMVNTGESEVFVLLVVFFDFITSAAARQQGEILLPWPCVLGGDRVYQ